MWIPRAVYEQVVADARASRAVVTQLGAELEAARSESGALRQALTDLQASTEADREALRVAAHSLHAHVVGGGDQVSKLATEITESAARAVFAEQRKTAALHERVAVADVNFGWCRQLVNALMAERSALLNQRGVLVPTVSLGAPGAPPGPPVAGAGVPGEFVDADAWAGAMGMSFDDVGDDAAAKMKLTPDLPDL